MKRLWIFTFSLLALVLLGITAWHFRPTEPSTAAGLFHRFEHQPGVRVGLIEGFSFNDTLRIDVVTVEALDSAGWQWMQQEFRFPPLDERRQALLDQGTDVMQTWQADSARTFLFLLRQRRSLCLVAVDDDRQYEAVFMYHLHKLKQQ